MSTDHDAEPATAPAAPLLRVVRGTPTPAELAALVAVVAARRAASAAAAASARPRVRSAWNEPARLVRTPLAPRVGRDGWRRSALPR